MTSVLERSVETRPDLRLVGELAPEPEYGRKPEISLSLDQIITVSQVRPGVNPEHEHLVESIATNGLEYRLSVAELSREKLADYLDFVHEVWGDQTDTDELAPHPNGNYYLLVDGHSRYAALKEVELKRQLNCADEGLEFRPRNVVCQLEIQPTPQRIIALQIEANIQSQPPSERTAMVLVENYEYGRRHGLWTNKAEYVRSCENKFSKYALNQALHFASLPAKARDFAFAGVLPYQTAVELGRQKDLLDTYYRQHFGQGDEDQTQDLTDIWYGRQVLSICNKGLSTAKAKLYIQNQVADFKAYLADDEPTLDFMINASDQAEEYRQQQLKAYKRELAELEAKPLAKWQNAVRLHRAIIGVKPEMDAIERAQERATNAAASVGATALDVQMF